MLLLGLQHAVEDWIKTASKQVGGVVVARYKSNPLEVISNVKKKIAEMEQSLPSKTLPDGTVSKVTVVPFYDRTGLIRETIGTLETALTHEILICIIVIIVLVTNLRASAIISGLLPIAVLMTFIVMPAGRGGCQYRGAVGYCHCHRGDGRYRYCFYRKYCPAPRNARKQKSPEEAIRRSDFQGNHRGGPGNHYGSADNDYQLFARILPWRLPKESFFGRWLSRKPLPLWLPCCSV